MRRFHIDTSVAWQNPAGSVDDQNSLQLSTLTDYASQDLTLICEIANHMAFESDGSQRNVALGICRMLGGVQLLVDKALNVANPAV